MTAAALAAVPAFAQKASLAERVARLEQQAAGQGGQGSSVELVNRITQLQSEVASLRNLVEQQQYEIEQLKQRNREQYLDLDGRLGRLEGRAPGTAPEAGGASAPPAPTPNRAGQLAASEPELAGSTAAAPAVGAAPTPGASTTPADPAGEQAAYEAPYTALKEGRYAEAARLFRSFIEQYPNSTRLPNAYYWLGESYYVTQNYEVARDTFQSLYQRFPESQKAAGALLKIGYCQIELDDVGAGEATLRQVVQSYPGSTEASLAESRLRGLLIDRQIN